MINPTGKKLQDLTSKLIDGEIEGVDKYTLNGSTWLIFTDQKRWVVEYTEDSILWYNFSFFTEIFEILGMKATDNQNLIQEWFESRFLRPEVKHTLDRKSNSKWRVEDTIQNGVKDTSYDDLVFGNEVEHTIQNGVKDTSFVNPYFNQNVEETIQNGVKETQSTFRNGSSIVEHTIQNGVKETRLQKSSNLYRIEDTIQNGVKGSTSLSASRKPQVEHTIQNGVKETYKSESTKSISLRWAIQNGVKHIENLPTNNPARIEDAIQNGVKHTEDGDWLDGDERFEDIIQHGVKEMQPLPAQDGNRDWGKYYHGKEDRTKPHTEYVKDVIKIGEKLNQDGI